MSGRRIADRRATSRLHCEERPENIKTVLQCPSPFLQPLHLLICERKWVPTFKRSKALRRARSKVEHSQP